MSKKPWLTSEKVNFIIALSAIVISIASFYATFLQAQAAEKQVKAMTLPLMTLTHGNYDSSIHKNVISFTVSNSGMGAAVVHWSDLIYQGERHNHHVSFLKACCSKEYQAHIKQVEQMKQSGNAPVEGGTLSSPIRNMVIPPQSSEFVFKMFQAPYNRSLWDKLNSERWQVGFEICYCTLLGDCFISNEKAASEPVESCAVKPS